MKKLLCLALLAIATQSVMAEKADSLKPGSIEFDNADLDKITRDSILTGNVVLTKGTLVMKADKAIYREDVDGRVFVTMTTTTSANATFRQKRDGGPDLWVEGQAQRIEYDGEKELVKLFSNAKFKQLENGKVMNEVGSEFIAYDSRKETFELRNTATGESKPGKGRGIMIIQPRTPKPASTGKQ